MRPLTSIIAAATGYLFGSISFARLVARVFSPGTDISKHVESVSDSDLVYVDDAVSATLVNLHIGPRYGCLTSVMDMLKAIMPMRFFQRRAPEAPYHLVVSAAALVGHNWPLYHDLKGGRGESVTYGSLLLIDPAGAVVCNVAALVLGFLAGQAHIVRWGGIVLLVPWLWFRTRDRSVLAWILFVNGAFWFAMRRDVRQYMTFHREGAFRNQEDLTDFLDMGPELGRYMDRYSIPALLARKRAGQNH
jgi:glycerol-3-phosphate acyltransferase PlsY